MSMGASLWGTREKRKAAGDSAESSPNRRANPLKGGDSGGPDRGRPDRSRWRKVTVRRFIRPGMSFCLVSSSTLTVGPARVGFPRYGTQIRVFAANTNVGSPMRRVSAGFLNCRQTNGYSRSRTRQQIICGGSGMRKMASDNRRMPLASDAPRGREVGLVPGAWVRIIGPLRWAGGHAPYRRHSGTRKATRRGGGGCSRKRNGSSNGDWRIPMRCGGFRSTRWGGGVSRRA